MALRDFIRRRMAQAAEEGAGAPVASLLHSVLGPGEQPAHALGEYTAATYPTELAELLRRREQVAQELLATDLTSAQARRQAEPRLLEMLKVYPHPMAYEALLLAYVDQARWEEAAGVAFAARERRWEVEHSPHPEIRAEVGPLKACSPEDVEAMRLERQGIAVPAGVPAYAPAVQAATA